MSLSMSLLGFGMGNMLANFHMCGIMLVLRAVLNMLVRNSRGAMCFMCLMFSLFYCLLDPSCGECNVISWYYFVVFLLMDLFVLCVVCLTVLLNCLEEPSAIVLGVVVICY